MLVLSQGPMPSEEQKFKDLYYMEMALETARLAIPAGEVPVGAVLVQGERVLAKAHNRREIDQKPTAHAELLAIEAAASKLGTWRLLDTRLYITLEPCPMCWGAILNARIPEIVFGAADPKAGVCGSVLSLHEDRSFNHHPKVTAGVLAEQSGEVLSEFFLKLRETKKKIGL